MQRVPVVKTKKLTRKKKIEVESEEEEEVKEEEKVLTRDEVLEKYGMSSKKFKDLSNIELINLMYCMETYHANPGDFVKKKGEITLPYQEVLVGNQVRHDYLLNYNSKSSVPLGDCRIPGCGAKDSVSYHGTVYSRGDEAGRLKPRCSVCKRDQ